MHFPQQTQLKCRLFPKTNDSCTMVKKKQLLITFLKPGMYNIVQSVLGMTVFIHTSLNERHYN